MEKIKLALFAGIIVLGLVTGIAWVVKSQYNPDSTSGPNSNWQWDNNWQQVPPGPSQDSAQEIASSYTDAIQRSGKNGKPVLAFFTAQWCQPCQQMKTSVLTDKSVMAVMTHYIFVMVDTDADKDAARKFSIQKIPAYVVTNYKEERLKFGESHLDAPAFASWLDNPSMYTQPKAPDEKPKDERRPRHPFRRQPQDEQGPPRNPRNRPGPDNPDGPNDPDGPPGFIPRQQPRS